MIETGATDFRVELWIKCDKINFGRIFYKYKFNNIHCKYN